MSTHVQGSVNPRDTLVRTQRIDGDDSSDSWSRYQPTTDAEIKKYAAFRRAFQARKDQQIKQQQQKERELQMIAKYWADAINNAYTVSGIFHNQDWMS